MPAGSESGFAMMRDELPELLEAVVEPSGTIFSQEARSGDAIRRACGHNRRENPLAQMGKAMVGAGDFKIDGVGSMPPGKT
jgi:hypothetical protein